MNLWWCGCRGRDVVDWKSHDCFSQIRELACGRSKMYLGLKLVLIGKSSDQPRWLAKVGLDMWPVGVANEISQAIGKLRHKKDPATHCCNLISTWVNGESGTFQAGPNRQPKRLGHLFFEENTFRRYITEAFSRSYLKPVARSSSFCCSAVHKPGIQPLRETAS